MLCRHHPSLTTSVVFARDFCLLLNFDDGGSYFDTYMQRVSPTSSDDRHVSRQPHLTHDAAATNVQLR